MRQFTLLVVISATLSLTTLPVQAGWLGLGKGKDKVESSAKEQTSQEFNKAYMEEIELKKKEVEAGKVQAQREAELKQEKLTEAGLKSQEEVKKKEKDLEKGTRKQELGKQALIRKKNRVRRGWYW
ncbi:MAG: hypothetical protein FJZ12_00745 [Candidatus Omnitrophica bacterium]|nr:hypothetical protein [Candidatus Omnitrophota bacterium]